KLKFRTASTVASEMHDNADMEAIRRDNENTLPERKLFPKMKDEKMSECENNPGPMWDLEMDRRRETRCDVCLVSKNRKALEELEQCKLQS
ncbi:unnamed protein product, partial [Allacma fusca]